MQIKGVVGRTFGVALIGAAMWGATVTPASAWPIPLTWVETNYLDAVRGNFPGNDDQLLLAGKQACRLLYTGQPAPAVISATAGQYGASPEQAATLVNAARGTMCTQAPG